MYPITSRFNDLEPFRKMKHNGIDFAMPNGTELKAVVEGKIQIIDYGNALSGKTVIIKGEDGMTYIYGHLSDFVVKNGDYVKIGDLLGYSGNSGNVFGVNGGYHLHFAIKNEQGQYIDPAHCIEFIQNMNNSQYMDALINKSNLNTANSIDFNTIIQGFSDGLSEISSLFGNFKTNFISIFTYFFF